MNHFKEEQTDFAVHLGDIIDGQNRMNAMSDVALQKVKGLRRSDMMC